MLKMRNKKISKVCIVGAGPIGLALSLFCEKLGVSYTLFEKSNFLQQYPAAHVLNLRTMEILKELDLDETIKLQSEPIELFRYYRYCRRIGELQTFGIQDHFAPSVEAKFKEISMHSEQ